MEITAISFWFYKSAGLKTFDSFHSTTRKMQFMHISFAKLWKLELRMTLSWRENFELQKAYFVNTNIWLFVNDAKWWCWWNFYDRSIAHVCRHILQWVETKHILYHNWMHSKNFKVNFKINSHNTLKMYLNTIQTKEVPSDAQKRRSIFCHNIHDALNSFPFRHIYFYTLVLNWILYQKRKRFNWSLT